MTRTPYENFNEINVISATSTAGAALGIENVQIVRSPGFGPEPHWSAYNAQQTRSLAGGEENIPSSITPPLWAIQASLFGPSGLTNTILACNITQIACH